MKTKKFEKKLSLNKKTIAHLNNGDMKSLQGGDVPSGCTCPFCQVNENSTVISLCPTVAPTCQTCATEAPPEVQCAGPPCNIP
jgi:natural product precursor